VFETEDERPEELARPMAVKRPFRRLRMLLNARGRGDGGSDDGPLLKFLGESNEVATSVFLGG
jgi:hypothetical protein